MIAKALAKGRQEAVAMIHLFRAHFLEHLRGRRKALAQPVGELAVNAAVLFLRGDGDGQNFPFAEVLEVLQHPSRSPSHPEKSRTSSQGSQMRRWRASCEREARPRRQHRLGRKNVNFGRSRNCRAAMTLDASR